jgi:hypothetical protein
VNWGAFLKFLSPESGRAGQQTRTFFREASMKRSLGFLVSTVSLDYRLIPSTHDGPKSDLDLRVHSGASHWPWVCSLIALQVIFQPWANADPSAVLEISAINPTQPINSRPWSVHFRLRNTAPTGSTLTGWIDAIAYDISDTTKARALLGYSLPIADVQPNEIYEGDLIFPTSNNVVNGVVELTYFQILSGYTPARSPDAVLQDVPPAVKHQLLAIGNAQAISTASSEFVVIPSEAEKLAVVFDFDLDSCYPSAAISDQGIVNPGLDEDASGIVAGCREPDQLQTSKTYYRKASIQKSGANYAVHMYALYFMKDKTVDTSVDAGHRHDWEFALIWTKNGAITHASFSHHGFVTTKPKSELFVDSGAENHVKVVYHKTLGTSHALRFANENEREAENHLGRWITPTLVDWHSMMNSCMSNQVLRTIFNQHDFGGANCSFNDHVFPIEVSKEPPTGPGFPSADEWKAAAMNQ